ncbi:hypothetical protein FRB93_000676 [Tulasnella sp. JGI-2019a]|nr:hypothetical protein FRB93_000676 [Tulasnella sp. JGI-2019a]
MFPSFTQFQLILLVGSLVHATPIPTSSGIIEQAVEELTHAVGIATKEVHPNLGGPGRSLSESHLNVGGKVRGDGLKDVETDPGWIRRAEAKAEAKAKAEANTKAAAKNEAIFGLPPLLRVGKLRDAQLLTESWDPKHFVKPEWVGSPFPDDWLSGHPYDSEVPLILRRYAESREGREAHLVFRKARAKKAKGKVTAIYEEPVLSAPADSPSLRSDVLPNAKGEAAVIYKEPVPNAPANSPSLRSDILPKPKGKGKERLILVGKGAAVVGTLGAVGTGIAIGVDPKLQKDIKDALVPAP